MLLICCKYAYLLEKMSISKRGGNFNPFTYKWVDLG